MVGSGKVKPNFVKQLGGPLLSCTEGGWRWLLALCGLASSTAGPCRASSPPLLKLYSSAAWLQGGPYLWAPAARYIGLDF